MRALIGCVVAVGVFVGGLVGPAAQPGWAAAGVSAAGRPAVAAWSGAGDEGPVGADATGDRAGAGIGQTPALPPVAGGPGSRLVVRFAAGAAPAQRSDALSAQGLAADGTAVAASPETVTVPVAAADVASALAALQADPRVESAQVDHSRSVAAWPNDPLLEYGWPYVALTELPRAWDATRGSGVVVAVLDTGVSAHEDLAGALLPGIDLVDGDADPSDPNGHGTAVAGVAAARGDNGLGSVGAAPSAAILPVRIADASGVAQDSTIAQGMDWAVAHGADVINLSFAGPDPAPVVLSAMQDAVAAGCVVVIASGNDGSSVTQYPAAYAPSVDGVLAVGATGDYGDVTSFSSWGDWVSLAAPGDQIGAPLAGGGYEWVSGTSFSAALVSGVAALVEAQGVRDPAQVESTLTRTARDAGPRGTDPYYGAGVVDAAAALGLLTAVPVDRVAGDPGPEDGTPAQAQPLTLGATWHRATLAPEGDQDWYRFTAPSAGYYLVTVSPTSTASGAASGMRPEVVALDAAGQTLATAGPAAAGAAVTLQVPAPAAGVVEIGVRDRTGSATQPPYAIEASGPLADPARFTRHDVSGGPSSPSLALADVTGDGVLDTVEGQPGTASVYVFPGVGGGSFGAPITLAADSGTTNGQFISGPVAADVDGDGLAEVVFGRTSGVGVIDVGPAGPVITSLAGVSDAIGAIAVADLEGDGDDDLVVTDAAGTFVLSQQPGGFVRGAVLAGMDTRYALADVTGDGLVDAVSLSGAVDVQQPDGSFLSKPSAGKTPGAWDLGVGDVTGDGRADIVRSELANGGHVYVNAGNGDGTFNAPVGSPAYEIPEALTLADVDRDGRLDVVVGNGGWDAVSVLFQQPDGTLSAPSRTPAPYSSHYWPGALQAADVNGDGAPDLVLAGGGTLSSFVQSPLGAVGPSAWLLDSSLAPHTAGVAVRPTLTFTLGRDLDPASLSAQSVRLVDDAGADVPATRAWDAGSHLLSLTPASDLVAGHHYEVVLGGLSDLSGGTQDEPYRTWFTVAAGGDRFTPVSPWRVLDTRNGTGGAYGAVSPGSPIRLALGGVEVPSDATAVVLNVTAVSPSWTGNVRVYPTPVGADVPPTVSNLNVVPGVDQPNLVTVSLGRDGMVSLATDGMSSQLIADVAGYYSPGGATGFVPLDPVRVMDTRNGTGGVPAGRLTAGHWVDLQVTGRNGVPADALAVVLNVTGVSPDRKTNVRVYPTPAASEDQAPPLVSNLNLLPGRDQPNLVTVAVGEGGRVRLYTQTADLNLVADLAGYYSETGVDGYVALAPTRIADSRSAFGLTGGRLVAGTTAFLQVAGHAGVPVTADSVVLNVTSVRPDRLSNVRVFPQSASGTVPLVSNLNVVAGRDEPNLVIVRLGTGGAVGLYSQSASLHAVVDVAGYFTR